MNSRLRAVLALPLAALLLTSCGNGEDDSSASSGGSDATTESVTPTPTPTPTPTESASDSPSPTAPPVSQNGEAKPYVDALTRSLEGEDSPMDPTQARCFSERFIDVVGLERVKRSGSPEEFGVRGMEFAELDLSEDEGNAIYDNFGGCGVDMHAALMQEMGSGELEPAVQRCFEQGATEEHVRDFFVTMMVQGAEQGSSTELMSVFLACTRAGQ